MKNKKGFTLIELLAVITILAVIVVIATTSVLSTNNSMKTRMLNEKADFIEETAILYGQDRKGVILNSTTTYEGNKCISRKVKDLVPLYLDKDNENECMENSDDASKTGYGCIVDPSDEKKFLDLKEVIIYFKNKRVKAKVDINDELSCS